MPATRMCLRIGGLPHEEVAVPPPVGGDGSSVDLIGVVAAGSDQHAVAVEEVVDVTGEADATVAE